MFRLAVFDLIIAIVVLGGVAVWAMVIFNNAAWVDWLLKKMKLRSTPVIPDESQTNKAAGQTPVVDGNTEQQQ